MTCNISQRIIRQPFLVYTRQTVDSIALGLNWTCFSFIVQWLYEWKLTINYAYRSVMWTVCLWLVHFMLQIFCIFSVLRLFPFGFQFYFVSALCNFSWENSLFFPLASDYPHCQLCLAQTTPTMREKKICSNLESSGRFCSHRRFNWNEYTACCCHESILLKPGKKRVRRWKQGLVWRFFYSLKAKT